MQQGCRAQLLLKRTRSMRLVMLLPATKRHPMYVYANLLPPPVLKWSQDSMAQLLEYILEVRCFLGYHGFSF